jgi:hypothetical protein
LIARSSVIAFAGRGTEISSPDEDPLAFLRRAARARIFNTQSKAAVGCCGCNSHLTGVHGFDGITDKMRQYISWALLVTGPIGPTLGDLGLEGKLMEVAQAAVCPGIMSGLAVLACIEATSRRVA